MRFRPKTRRIMMIVFAVVVITVMVVPSTLPTVAGCVPPRKRSAVVPAATGPVRVHAPNGPIASLVRALSPEAAVSGGWSAAKGDPAYWKPGAGEIAAVQSAELIVLNGAGYEPWAAQAALPRARTLDLSLAVAPQLIAEKGETHSHGPEGDHSHAGTAFTTWLSPAILRAQAQALALELIARRPSDKDAIESRLGDLTARLVAIEADLALVAKAQPAWLGSHPVYQYLAQAGGLTIDCVHWEPGEMPGEEAWTKFGVLRAGAPRPTAWMLWEGDPGQAIRDRLKSEGVEVLVLAPLGAGDGALTGDLPGDFVAYLADRVKAMRTAVAAQ